MQLLRKRKCKSCGELYYPDVRNKKRQKYCCNAECRRASKAASQANWLGKPENKDYFRGAANVERVREWRKRNPGYSKRRANLGTKPEKALQDSLMAQVVENKGESGDLVNLPLQDVLMAQPPVIIGLIANLTGSTLQDDIVSSSRELIRLGEDILGGVSNVRETSP